MSRFIGTGCLLYFTRICLVLPALPKFLKDFLSNLISDLLTNLFPDFLSNLFSDFLTNLFPHLFARVFENPVFYTIRPRIQSSSQRTYP